MLTDESGAPRMAGFEVGTPMSDDITRQPGFTRREFLRTAGAGALAMGLGADSLAAANPPTAAAGAARSASGPDGAVPYNILFILTDQERFFRPGELPAGCSRRISASGSSPQSSRLDCTDTSARGARTSSSATSATR